MTELLKNEIGDNKISTKIGEIDGLEKKIKDSYKEIYETKGELQDLKKEIMNNLSGKSLKALLEKELTIDHVKNVLHKAAENSNAGSTFSSMDAGVIFNMQLGLAKLGYNFSNGIDGMYGADTGKRVKEFQKQWNTQHPEDKLPQGERDAHDTLTRLLTALEDTQWKGAHYTPEQKEVETYIAPVSFEESMKDRETMDAHHLEFTPLKGYEFVDPTDPLNLATKKKGKILGNTPMVTFDEVMKNRELDKYHLGIKPTKKYEWAHPSDANDYATKAIPAGVEVAPNTQDEPEATPASGKWKIKVSYDGWKEQSDAPIPANNVYEKETPLYDKVSMKEAIKDRASMERNHLRFLPQEGYERAGNYPDNLALRKIGTMKEDVPMIVHEDVVRYLENGGYPIDIQPEDGYDWAEKWSDNYATKPMSKNRPATSSEDREEKMTYLSENEAMKNPEKYHLVDDGKQLKPMRGYRWADKNDQTNYATVRRTNIPVGKNNE